MPDVYKTRRNARQPHIVVNNDFIIPRKNEVERLRPTAQKMMIARFHGWSVFPVKHNFKSHVVPTFAKAVNITDELDDFDKLLDFINGTRCKGPEYNYGYGVRAEPAHHWLDTDLKELKFPVTDADVGKRYISTTHEVVTVNKGDTEITVLEDGELVIDLLGRRDMLPETPVWQRSGGGGKHRYYADHESSNGLSKTNIFKDLMVSELGIDPKFALSGIDTRSPTGWIAGPGNLHPSGGEYDGDFINKARSSFDVPQAIDDFYKNSSFSKKTLGRPPKKKGETTAADNKRRDVDLVAQVREWLDFVDVSTLDHEGWLKVVMAVSYIFDGTDIGFELLDEWSSLDENKERIDPEKLRKRYRSLKRKPGGVTGATLRRMALEAGWQDPESIDWKALFEVHERWNKQHAVVLSGGKVELWGDDDEGLLTRLGTTRDLGDFYANKRITLHGDVQYPEYTLWMKWQGRRTYNGVVFDPSEKYKGPALNTWTGFAAERMTAPKKGEDLEAIIEPLTHHLKGTLGDQFDYFCDYVAQSIQEPEIRPDTGIALIGSPGSGKDTIGEIIARLVGDRHSHKFSPTEDFTARFNPELGSKLWLRIEEGSAVTPAQAAWLRTIITGTRQNIEAKGRDKQTIDTFFRVIVTSETMHTLRITEGDRRWAVIGVSNQFVGNREHFTRVHAAINNDHVIAAFYHWLLERDIRKFDPRKLDMTDAKRENIVASLDINDRWWVDFVEERRDPNGPRWQELRDRGDTLSMLNGRRHERRAPPITQAEFGRLLRTWLPEGWNTQGPRPRTPDRLGKRNHLLKLPPIAEVIAAKTAWFKQ